MRYDGEPIRRRALQAEFSGDEWRLASQLSDYPNRLLVTATTETGENYAEVAHEAIFRRWGKLRDWIRIEREFLVWRSGLEAACRAWETTPDKTRNEALLMGLALAQAKRFHATRGEDLTDAQRRFINRSNNIKKLNLQRTFGMGSMLALFVTYTYSFVSLLAIVLHPVVAASLLPARGFAPLSLALTGAFYCINALGTTIAIYFNSRIAAIICWIISAICIVAPIMRLSAISVLVIPFLIGGAIGVHAVFSLRRYAN